MSIHQTKHESVLRVQGDLNFAVVQGLHLQLLKLFNDSRYICLDLSEVGSLDLAGLQLVYAALASATNMQVRFRIHAGAQGERLKRLSAFSGLPSLPLDALPPEAGSP